MPKGGCDPMRSPHWSRLLVGPEDPWRESSRWSRLAGRTCDSVDDPHWSSLFLKDCTPWKGLMLEQMLKSFSLWKEVTLEKFMEGCVSWEGPHSGPGEECEESSPEEGVAETTCVGLTTSPIPHPPAPLRGGGR
ncbi:neurexin-3-hypothetical protein [Limosa lapponica baueri]|uniref:Uncharacterized protein n=1 Tax=Limosa lapponica baueri TaxID=1758121 RepID=A0A2I0U1H2_LIMLA|nr:neurexin-3-hypothetical protein [Limosa lapponica baueri]